MSDAPLTVGLLGFGTMGTGIAQCVAQVGHRVIVWEPHAAQRTTGWARLEAFLQGGISRGKLTEADADGVRERVALLESIEEIAGSDLVIEAVFENRDVKRVALAQLSELAPAPVLLVSNTSALALSDLATVVQNPERFAGLHFFNPAPVMSAVEVVGALQTSPETVVKLTAFVESLGKAPVVVPDRPGFLVNHLLIPYLNDVIAEYDAGLAEAQDIDTAIKLGLGHRTGPLELLDMIGLDVHLHASEGAYAETADPGFAPPPLLRRMVAAGYCGTKSGRGFRIGVGQ